MITSLVTAFFGVSALACALLMAVAVGLNAERHNPKHPTNDELKWAGIFMGISMAFALVGVILLLLRSP